MSYGRQLRVYRKRLGVSAQELAEELGWAHRSAVTRREKGQIPISKAVLLELCAAAHRVVAGKEKAATPADLLA